MNNTYYPINTMNTELFAEIGRLNILLNERDKEIERLKGLLPPDEREEHTTQVVYVHAESKEEAMRISMWRNPDEVCIP